MKADSANQTGKIAFNQWVCKCILQIASEEFDEFLSYLDSDITFID